jgi:hypothetical protein
MRKRGIALVLTKSTSSFESLRVLGLRKMSRIYNIFI